MKCIQIALDAHDYTIYTVEFFVNICTHFELNTVRVAVASVGRMTRQPAFKGHETDDGDRERERERERENVDLLAFHPRDAAASPTIFYSMSSPLQGTVLVQ